MRNVPAIAIVTLLALAAASPVLWPATAADTSHVDPAVERAVVPAAPAPCHYPDAIAPEPSPSMTAAPPGNGASQGAVAVVLVQGVLSAEGWVPPPGSTCPPQP